MFCNISFWPRFLVLLVAKLIYDYKCPSGLYMCDFFCADSPHLLTSILFHPTVRLHKEYRKMKIAFKDRGLILFGEDFPDQWASSLWIICRSVRLQEAEKYKNSNVNLLAAFKKVVSEFFLWRFIWSMIIYCVGDMCYPKRKKMSALSERSICPL